jgi:hypothetical protein
LFPNELPLRIGEAQRVLHNLVQVFTCYGVRGDPRKLKLAMLTAYFDESGTGSKEQLCVVGGFVGNEAQWAAFANDWINALGKNRDNLHLTKLRWGRRYDKIVKDLAQLGPIPRRYNLTPVFVGMWHKDFEELFKGKVREAFTDPYMTCVQQCMAVALHYLVSKDDEIQFILDWQEGRRARMMNKLHDIAFKFAKMEPRVKTLHFTPMRSTVCLDPADYLVFALREGIIDQNSDKAKASASILAYPLYGGIIERKRLKEIADHYIAHGMVPGGGPIKMSDQLAAALLKAGWSQEKVGYFANTALSGMPPKIENRELP